MSTRFFSITFGAHDVEHQAHFWGSVLDRGRVTDAHGGVTLAGTSAGQPTIRFMSRDEPKTTANRAHFDLTSESTAHQELIVARALAAGAEHLDIGQGADAEHTVLADPEGNEFCVIPPGNAFLAGTGAIGCIACDGSQSVGYFWSRALGWPLVWDQDEETAIQASGGGSKISWGGGLPAPQTGYNRAHFDLAVTDEAELGDAVARLESLDAGHWTGPVCGDALGFVDPDGTEFCLMVAP